MTDGKPNVDAYAVLEFVGFVCDVPQYDAKRKYLWFVAEPLAPVSMRFLAKGDLASAFKSMLHKGCVVQLQAVPSQRLTVWKGEKSKITVWVVKSMRMLGRRKVKLQGYEDLRILDGLMPVDTDVEDVGYVDYDSFSRFIGNRKALKDLADSIKEEDPND